MDYEYILVDCFDTVFHRKNSSESTLYIWAREMSQFLDNRLPSETIYRNRKMAENRLRKSKEEPSYYEVIGEVYRNLEVSDAREPNFEKFIQKSYEIDLLAEKSQLYVDDSNVRILKNYKEEGKKVILVSDFYMPKKFMETILKEFSIDEIFTDIYVSSETGFRKSTGNLYKYILDVYGQKPEKFLMLGDDKVSDVIMAENNGIKTRYLRFDNKKMNYSKMSGVKRSIRKTVWLKNENDLFKGFSPAMIIFCDRLYYEARKRKCKKLLFCSREGQLLKKLFDRYQKKLFVQNSIPTEYFYVSRRATMLPSLKNIQEEKFERIFRQYKELTIYDFLCSIGFSEEEIETILEVKEYNKRIHPLDYDTSLQCFIKREKFIQLYEQKRLEQKVLLMEYVKQVNGTLDEVYLVDIGWKGTIQDNLYEALDKKSKIYGFYFGIYGYESNEENSKIGIMFDQYKDEKINELFQYDHIKLETVFSANHGAVLSYRKENGNIQAILSEKGASELSTGLKDAQKLLMETYTKLLKIVLNSPYREKDLEQILNLEYLRFQCLEMPRFKKVFESYADTKHENFGNISGIKEKIPQVNYQIHRKMNSKLGYVGAAYKILERFHVQFLFPIAWGYCRCVFYIKICQYKLTKQI